MRIAMRLVGAALAVALVSGAGAQPAFWSGDLDAASPTFQRPLQDGSGLSAVGTAVRYHVQPFYVGTTGSYVFEMGQLVGSPSLFDPFIVVYADGFDPTDGLLNFHAGNDDFSGAFTVLNPDAAYETGSLRRSRLTTGLVEGTQYYAINTAFGNGAGGPFDAAIGGDGRVILGIIPEPASALLLGLGLLVIRRR